jgi:hypothetical protein
MPSIIAAILAPFITALLAAIGVWWKGRRDRRDSDQERHRVLAQVHEEIDVIEAWIKAYALVVPHETKPEAWSRAENDLESAYVRLTGSLDVSRGVETRPTFGQYFKVLLLIHSLQSRRARVIRILYYVSLGGVAIWVSSIAIVGISQPSDWGSTVIGLVVFLIGNLLISAGSYMLVLRLDRRARVPATHPPEVQIGSTFRSSA